jgi:hypothetical protein
LRKEERRREGGFIPSLNPKSHMKLYVVAFERSRDGTAITCSCVTFKVHKCRRRTRQTWQVCSRAFVLGKETRKARPVILSDLPIFGEKAEEEQNMLSARSNFGVLRYQRGVEEERLE